MTAAWTNFLELRVCGVMRSGNHAIIEWIINQHADQPACFLNNILHGNHDPYTNYRQRVLYGFDEAIDTEELRNANKRLLIYSYEDRSELENNQVDFLSSATQPGYELSRRALLKSSQHFIDVLIIRDPFNCFASRFKLLQTRGAMGGLSEPKLIVNNWKTTAKAALSINACLEPDKMLIRYNHWVTDLEYRKQLSKALLGTFNDASRAKIAQFGGGSSFQDGATLADPQQNPDSLKVSERWKQMQTDETYLRAISAPEVLELSERLFGEIPGTRELVQAYRLN